MRKVVRLMAISLLALGLAACDGANKDNKQPVNGTPTSPPVNQTLSLLDGKLTFSLPIGMADQSSKLNSQVNNRYVYADSSGQRVVIVLLGDKTSESLEVLVQRLEHQLRTRDANLEVISNKTIDANGTSMRQLNTIITDNGQKSYTSTLLALVDDNLLTIQIILPADNPQQAQDEAQLIINTLKFSK